jgi:branched-chain amino acid transport system ATP-binding protein
MPGPESATTVAVHDAIRVDDVWAGYGSVSVLEGVSLRLAEREVVTVLGPNGAGKTTLLRVVSGVVPARSGRVEVAAHAGRRVAHAIARSGIAHVPEGRGVFPGLTVTENLAVGTFGRGRRVADTDVTETMAFVLELFPWIAERLGQLGGTLSGGEQQMLAIARALMSNPRALILDEPSLGLSPLIAGRVFETLGEIRARGVAILLVEQNLTHALALADRGYVMNSGRIVLEGDADELARSDMFRRYLEVA